MMNQHSLIPITISGSASPCYSPSWFDDPFASSNRPANHLSPGINILHGRPYYLHPTESILIPLSQSPRPLSPNLYNSRPLRWSEQKFSIQLNLWQQVWKGRQIGVNSSNGIRWLHKIINILVSAFIVDSFDSVALHRIDLHFAIMKGSLGKKNQIIPL